eukprot:9852275-Alexandrium_andersonii.AAC.1
MAEKSASTRARYTGSIEALADALEMDDPGWLRYRENAEVREPVNPDKILAAKPMITKLRQLQDNLAFTKSSVEQALLMVATRHKKEWQLGRPKVIDYKKTVGARVRLLCRDIMQARRRSKPPAWISRLFGLT